MQGEPAALTESAPPPWPRGAREVGALLAFIATCFAVSALGALVTGPAIDGWYQDIRKPVFNPPAWIFGPVWTLLYALMGWSAFLAWKSVGLRSRALLVFGIQLLLNGIWSPVFFGLGKPGAAFFVILLLWMGIAATIMEFRRVERRAALLLLPYLAWVSFASVLNGAIWQLNPQLG